MYLLKSFDKHASLFFKFRVEEYIRKGKDKDIVDPDPDNIYLKRKQHRSKHVVSEDERRVPVVKFPEGNWGSSLRKMPMFTRAEMNDHVTSSGKNIASKETNSVPTSFRKAKTFLEDEYLHNIETNDDQRCFYVRAKCFHSFKKSDPPHELKLALCIITGDVLKAVCSCLAGTVGYCNHILALMLKLCKFVVHDCKTTRDLCHESDQNPSLACTSELQKWHKKGGGSNIMPEPIMNVTVNKTKVEDTSSKRGGIKSLLFEARVNPTHNQDNENKLKSRLKDLFPNMGFSQMAEDRQYNNLVDTKYGKCPAGSVLSYQLAFTESKFSAHVDVSALPRNDFRTQLQNYPRFPLVEEHDMNIPDTLNDTEQLLMNSLYVDENKISHIEEISRKQSACDEWHEQRRYRFTASSFDMIVRRKRNHDTFAKNIMYPPALTNKYVEHGKKYEPVALMEYQSYMKSKKMPVTVIPSGFVVSQSNPVLGASPDGKVVDPGCCDCFGLAEVKCPWTKANVTPMDACADPKFFMEKTGENICRLKRDHSYYTQVQGQMGVTGARWCDFIVYTRKGIYVECWAKLRDELIAYYFQHFIKYAAEDFASKTPTEADKHD